MRHRQSKGRSQIHSPYPFSLHQDLLWCTLISKRLYVTQAGVLLTQKIFVWVITISLFYSQVHDIFLRTMSHEAINSKFIYHTQPQIDHVYPAESDPQTSVLWLASKYRQFVCQKVCYWHVYHHMRLARLFSFPHIFPYVIAGMLLTHFFPRLLPDLGFIFLMASSVTYLTLLHSTTVIPVSCFVLKDTKLPFQDFYTL